MSAFSDFIQNIPKEYLPRVENAISDACRVLGDPNATQEAHDRVTEQLTDLQHRIGGDSLRALQEEIKSRIANAGRSGVSIQELNFPQLNLMNRMETIRKAARWSYWTPFKESLAKSFVLIGVFSAATLVAVGSLKDGSQVLSGIGAALRNAEFAKEMAQVQMQLPLGEYELFASRIKDASKVFDIAKPPLPEAIKAMAATGIKVTIKNPPHPDEVRHMSLESFYGHAPPTAKPEIEKAAAEMNQTGNNSQSRCRPMKPFAANHGDFKQHKMEWTPQC